LESRGTLRLLKLLRPVLHALDTGGLVLVDEIDSSIHALLSRKIVSLFSSKETNKRGAQIIGTTHDTTLLCADFLRRDQIWFTEKDRTGTTHLFPLTDIKTRNTDNFEKGYLQGRFGAVPFLGPIEGLLAERA
jgi:AAA15 family ATPase/GTPase